jgi:hypothetical protein
MISGCVPVSQRIASSDSFRKCSGKSVKPAGASRIARYDDRARALGAGMSLRDLLVVR